MVLNGDANFTTLNLANNSFETVTVDYASTNMSSPLLVDGIKANTDLTVENVTANGNFVFRNNAGTYSILEGSVDQSNTLRNIDYSVNDSYIGLENYAYFSVATELNLTETVDNIITGGTITTGSDEGVYVYDFIELQADNATINLTYNLTDILAPDYYTYIDAEVENGATADVADVVNVVFNIDNVDGLEVYIDANSSGVSSDSDTATLNLNGLANTDDNNYFELDDFETLNINVTADSDVGYIDAYSNVSGDTQTVNIVADAALMMTGDSFDLGDSQEITINISGSGNVMFDMNGDNYGVTVNAGDATGNLDLGVGSDATYATLVTSGSGDDTITLLNAFELNVAADAFLQVLDGGDGMDTFEIDTDDLVTSQALLNADVTDFSNAIINFERLSLMAVADQVIDATTLGFNDVTIDGYTTGGSLTVDTDASVTVTGAGIIDYAVIVTDAATGATDMLNLTVNGADGITLAGLTVADVETINLTSSASAPDDTAPGANGLALLADATVTLNISGETALDMTGSSLVAVETVDAASFDAGLTIDLSSSAEAVTITTGNGADVVVGSDQNDTISVGDGGNTVTAGLGLDTITLGSGATADDIDTLVYAAVGDSQGVTVDVISGFQVDVQATTDTNADDVVNADDIINDVLDFSAFAAGLVGAAYAGEASGYGAVLTTLDGVNSLAVLDTTTSTLYFDVDHSGTLDNSDIAIQLSGVDALSADNFLFA